MDESIIKRARRVLKEEGYVAFISKGIRYTARKSHGMIRPLLPKSGFQTRNSVKTQEAKVGDSLFNSVTHPKYENGVVKFHKKYTQNGDSVVIIGGGHGVTAVRNAKIVGETGAVTIFEGGKESVEEIEKITKINNVGDICNVQHVIVGRERNVYGGDTVDAEIIHPDNLPACDILELDCEGAEVDILDNLKIRPRAIIVELHPWHYSEPPEKPIEALKKRGYDITYYSGHDGIEISEKEFHLLLNKSKDQLTNDQGPKNRWYTNSGARWPVVAGAIYTEHNVKPKSK